jgi:hypothetical protein
MEPRVLFSADTAAALGVPLVVEQRSVDSAGAFVSQADTQISTARPEQVRQEIAFVETNTPGYQQLVDDIESQSQGQRQIQVVLLDPSTDGIDQISAVLAARKEVAAVHLISHGADGQVQLGTTTLNFDSLLKNAAKIKAWSQSLSAGADFLLYGCDVAQAEDGKALIDALGRLTGADVAASDDTTGAQRLGGNWTLEYQTGDIETLAAVSPADQSAWDHLLPVVNSAPAGTDHTVSMAEDGSYTFAAADFGFTDPNDSPANALAGVIVTTVPSAGSLTLSGAIVTAGQTITLANINANKLKFAPGANANGTGYAGFTFQVQDNGGTANGGVDVDPSPNTMAIDVTAVNDAPVLLGANDMNTLDEDPVSNNGTLVSSLIAGMTSDADAGAVTGIAVIDVQQGNGNWKYSIDGGTSWQPFAFGSLDASHALLLPSNAYIRFSPGSDWNGTTPNAVTFRAWDQTSGTAGGSADTTVNGGTSAFSTAIASANITVNSVNDAPAGSDKTITITEGMSYTFTTSDFGFSDSHDSPANSLAAVKIATLPAAGTLTISGAAVSAGQSVSQASIAAGNLKFTPVTNGAGTGYASFTFQVQDNGGTSNGGVDIDPSPNTMTINVTPVNDAPAGTTASVTTLEDTAYTFASADFGFSDPNDSPANQLAAVRITTIPGAGSLMLSGIAVTAGQSISAANLMSGSLKFVPAGNANGTGYATFTFQVQDDGGTASGGVDLDASPNAMTINVTPVNDAPAGASATVTTLEDSAYTFTSADFGFSDPNDSQANQLAAVRVTTIPGAGSLMLSGIAVTAGQSISVANLASGNLKFTPAANANGTGYATFTFQVQDDGGTASGGMDLDASPNVMTINVTPVNDAPTGTSATVTILEDTVYTFASADFGFSDPNDSPANSLGAVKITAVPAAGILSLSGLALTAGQTVSIANINAGNLKFAPDANANGAAYASLTFQVQDNGGTAGGGVDIDTSSNVITVNVTPVNDAPAGTDITVSTPENVPYTFASTNFGFTDAADSPASLFSTVQIMTLPVTGSLTLAGSAVVAGQMILVSDIAASHLQYIPPANETGIASATFGFKVHDDGGTANGGVDWEATSHLISIDVVAPSRSTVAAGTLPMAPAALAVPAVVAAASGPSVAPQIMVPPHFSNATNAGTITAEPLELASKPGGDADPPLDQHQIPLKQAGSEHVSKASSPARGDTAHGGTQNSPRGGVGDIAARGALGTVPLLNAMRSLGSMVAGLPPLRIGEGQLVSFAASDMELGREAVHYSMETNQTVLTGGRWVAELDRMRKAFDAPIEAHDHLFASSLMVTGGVSVGYVVWLLRGGFLLGSLLSSLPAWHVIDPLPVLARSKRRADGDAPDADPLERLFNKAKAVAGGAGKCIAPEVIPGDAQLGEAHGDTDTCVIAGMVAAGAQT